MLTIDKLQSGGYETVIVAASDVQGRLFGRRVPLRRFLGDPAEGVDVCTCALAWDTGQDISFETALGGWHTGWHDFRLIPDLATLRPYPGSPGTAICLTDALHESGEPLEPAPRTVLRRQVERAAALGYEVRMASELEFYLFEGNLQEARLRRFTNLQPTTLVRSDYSIVGGAVQEPFIAAVRRAMEAADIPVYACQAEYGLGQWEVNLEHAEVMECADRHVVYKAGLKEMALAANLSLTFMPKPRADDFGSSCHMHCSLWRAGRPVFPGSDGHDLSPEGRAFLGGLMEHLGATALLFAPHVNSYKRNASEDVAGGVIAWGRDNRTVNCRVVGSGPSLRIEHRFAGADANPYLAAAAIIAAGLDGMERGTDPGPPIVDNAYIHPELGRAPNSLSVAVDAWRGSPFPAAAFGQGVVDHYATIARAEWASFMRAVTDWEIMTDFEIV